MPDQKTLVGILNVPEAETLQAAIIAKGASPSLDALGDPEKALRFIRSNLRGSYLFARFAVPSYAAAVFSVLRDFPPVTDALGTVLTRIIEAVKGELLNNNIFERPHECHSHYHDALEAYQAAGGDVKEVGEFAARAAVFGFERALAESPFWSPGSVRYARALMRCCDDPLAMFILMPANEELAPRVYARALEALPQERRFAKFRQFFARHVELDQGDHGPAALEWLDLYIEKTGPGPVRIRDATEKVIAYVTG